MRAATAALPEPCSATTSTGTSFCDSSRIMASTVRMPALTLSIQIRALPFCGAPAVARISVLSTSILLRFTQTPFDDIWRPKKSIGTHSHKGLTQSRAHSLPNQPKCLRDTRDNIYFIFNELLPIPVVGDVLLRYHIADKWEIYCPPPSVLCGHYFPPAFGNKVLTPGVPPSCCPFRAIRFAASGLILFGLLCGYCAVSVKTAGVATPVAVAVMVMVLGDGGRV